MAILGISQTEDYAANRFTNIRRSVFYFYPNGATTLTGLLSLMGEEDTNDPKFSHWESRLPEQRNITATQGSSKGPFKTSGDADAGDPLTVVNGTTYILVVAVDAAAEARFRPGHVIQIQVDLTSGTGTVTGVVTVVDTANQKITFRANKGTAAVKNGATNENVGKEVLVIGSAFAQGREAVNDDIHEEPTNIENFTQIFRTPWLMTGSALKTGAKYDKSGPYKDKAKQASVNHMLEMEKAFLFGTKNLHYSAATKVTTTGAGLPTYTTGGILHFLELWEAGATYGNSAATADTDDNKRIIENTGGSINFKTYSDYLERCFRVTNNTVNEKLVLCGSGFLNVINQMYEGRTALTSGLPLKDTFGMDVVKHVTPFGTVYYKSHPLFSQNSAMRNQALFLDVHNLKYRFLQGRDTELLKNRQPNDADYRKDEYLTECGLELRFPESFMYLKNINSFTP
ncbi:MAG: hypothetical protein COA57_14860 [Flavobacteriales bacterium]|nr:MAG: hypothetical protein COA57_14860 [Flavobacteriales bacterium]